MSLLKAALLKPIRLRNGIRAQALGGTLRRDGGDHGPWAVVWLADDHRHRRPRGQPAGHVPWTPSPRSTPPPRLAALFRQGPRAPSSVGSAAAHGRRWPRSAVVTHGRPPARAPTRSTPSALPGISRGLADCAPGLSELAARGGTEPVQVPRGRRRRTVLQGGEKLAAGSISSPCNWASMPASTRKPCTGCSARRRRNRCLPAS